MILNGWRLTPVRWGTRKGEMRRKNYQMQNSLLGRAV